MSYDSWLEKPYQDRADEDEAFEAWKERMQKEDDLSDEERDALDFSDFEDYCAAEDEDRQLAWDEMRAEESRFERYED